MRMRCDESESWPCSAARPFQLIILAVPMQFQPSALQRFNKRRPPSQRAGSDGDEIDVPDPFSVTAEDCGHFLSCSSVFSTLRRSQQLNSQGRVIAARCTLSDHDVASVRFPLCPANPLPISRTARSDKCKDAATTECTTPWHAPKGNRRYPRCCPLADTNHPGGGISNLKRVRNDCPWAVLDMRTFTKTISRSSWPSFITTPFILVTAAPRCSIRTVRLQGHVGRVGFFRGSLTTATLLCISSLKAD